jgi:hypothetical protein
MATQGYVYGSMNFDEYNIPMDNYTAYMSASANHDAMTRAGFPPALVAQHSLWHQPYAPETLTAGDHMGY